MDRGKVGAWYLLLGNRLECWCSAAISGFLFHVLCDSSLWDGVTHCAGLLSVYVAGVLWEGGASAEELLPLGWSLGHFLSR